MRLLSWLSWLSWLIHHRSDDAWQEGYALATDEADEVVADKDAFIAEQSGIIVELIDVINTDCPKLFESMPQPLYQRLADYV